MAKKQSLKQGEKVLFGVFGAFVIAAVIGYAILEYVRAKSDTPMFQSKTSYEFTEAGLRGSQSFRKAGCTACHRAMRNCTNMGLNLDGIGTKRSYEWIAEFLIRPEETYGTVTLDHGMPPKEASYVSQLDKETLHEITEFLFGLKAGQGAAASPMPPEGDSQFINGMLDLVAPDDWSDKYQDIRTKEPVQAE